MKKLVLPLVAVLFGLGLAAPQEGVQTTRGDVKRVLKPSMAGGYGRKRALIIGISKYRNLKGLNYAAQDATDLYNLLIEKFGYAKEDIVLIKDGDATKDRINEELLRLSDPKVGGTDSVVVFFAGHGESYTITEGDNKSYEKGFIMPVDAKLVRKTASAAETVAISSSSIQTYLEDCPARHVLFIADCCFGAALVNTRASSEPLLEPAKEEIGPDLDRKARQFLVASGNSEVAQEDPKLGHGVFSYFVLSALKEAAASWTYYGARNLESYTRARVKEHTGRSQLPILLQSGTLGGEFVFVVPGRAPTPGDFGGTTTTGGTGVGPTPPPDPDPGPGLSASAMAEADLKAWRAIEAGNVGKAADYLDTAKKSTRNLTLAADLIDDSPGTYEKALTGYRQAARLNEADNSGDPIAQWRVGYMMWRGWGETKTEAEGLRIMAKTAPKLQALSDSGDPYGSYTYGLHKLYVDRNFEEAKKRFRWAAKGGSNRAVVELALLDGETPSAFRQLEEVEDSGNPDIAYEIARRCDLGLGTQKNPTRALSHYKIAAGKGNVRATVRLAELS